MLENKCYRVYVDNEVVGTYFNRMQAMFDMGDWFGAGYTAESVELREEEY